MRSEINSKKNIDITVKNDLKEDLGLVRFRGA